MLQKSPKVPKVTEFSKIALFEGTNFRELYQKTAKSAKINTNKVSVSMMIRREHYTKRVTWLFVIGYEVNSSPQVSLDGTKKLLITKIFEEVGKLKKSQRKQNYLET